MKDCLKNTFRPESGGPDPIPGGWEDTLVKGTVSFDEFLNQSESLFKVVDELVRAYSDWVMLVIRLYHQTKVDHTYIMWDIPKNWYHNFEGFNCPSSQMTKC